MKMLPLLLGLSFFSSLDLNDRGIAVLHLRSVKDEHGTELAAFQAECYGPHVLRVLVEATRLQLV